MSRTIYIFLFLTLLVELSYCQHGDGNSPEFKKHHLSLLGGVAFVPAGEKLEKAAAAAGVAASETVLIVAPTLGLEYEYLFSSKWSVALMTDLELKDYEIKVGDGRIIRENIWIISVVGMYKITHRLVFYAGPGYEIEKHHNFWLLRTGLKYEFNLGNDFDISPSIEFDWKEEYTSHFVGITVGKKF